MDNSNTPANENVGRLVHFTGNVTVDDSTIDFGASDGLNVTKPVSNAILLKRTVYIWQKFEVATQSTKQDFVGGGETRTTTYTLKEDWTAMGPQKDCPNVGETNSRGVWDQIMAVTGGAEEPISSSPTQANPLQAAMQAQGPMPLEMAQAMGLYNPNKPPQAMKVCDCVRVGEFYLIEKILLGNPAVFTSGAVPVPSDCIPESVPGCEFLFKGSENTLQSFPEGQLPHNGDVKIVYEYVTSEFPASFIVAQTTSVPEEAKETGVKYGVDQAHVTGRCNNDLGQIWMVRKGTHNLYEMLDMAKEDESKVTNIIRVVGWAVLCAGWIMFFTPLTTILQVLPVLSQLGYFAVVLTSLIVSCLCCCTVMAIAYLRYRPVITGGILILSIIIWGIVIWRVNDAAEEYTDPPTSAPILSN
jgi:hypothetical protein